MIKFKQIRFKNILSYPNNFTTYEFISNNKITIIQGKNGSGKSTLIDAIYFVMFGMPYRKITLEQLLNSNNKNNLLVEIELDFKNNSYLIRRGKNPNIFEIYKNEILIPLLSSVAEYQKLLNKELNINESIFNQTTIRTLTKNLNFVELNKGSKREIIENMFNLNIFSLIRDSLLDDQRELKDNYKDLQSKINSNIKLLEGEKKHNLQLESTNDELKKEYEELIKINKNEIIEEILNLEDRKLNLKKEFDVEKHNILLKIEKIKYENNKELENIQNKIINIPLLKANQLELKNKIKKLNIYQKQIESELVEDKLKLKNYEESLIEYNKLKNEIENIKNDISKINIDELKNDIEYNENNKKLLNELQATLNSYTTILDTICINCERITKIREVASEISTNIFNISYKEVNIDLIKEHELKNIQLNKIEYLLDKIKIDKPITKIEENIEYINKIELKTSELELELNKINDELSELERLKNLEDKLDDRIELLNNNIYSLEITYNNNISNIENQINNFNLKLNKKTEFKPISIDYSLIYKYEESINNYETESSKIVEYEGLVTELRNLLMDETLQRFVIRKYLPLINNTFAKYSSELKTDLNLYFDDEFELIIRSPYKEKLSYYNFSEGQKKKINLAIMFTFIDFLKVSNNYSESNLLLLDEITAGLDIESEIRLYDLLKSIVKDTDKEIILINHSNLADNIDFRKFIVEKTNYSKLN